MALSIGKYIENEVSKFPFKQPYRVSKNFSDIQTQIIVSPITSPNWEMVDVMECEVGDTFEMNIECYEPNGFQRIQNNTFFPGPRPHESGNCFGGLDEERELIIHKNGCIHHIEYIECDKTIQYNDKNYEISTTVFPTLAVRLMHILQFAGDFYSNYVIPKGEYLDNVKILIRLQSKNSMLGVWDEKEGGEWKMCNTLDKEPIKGTDPVQYVYTLSDTYHPKSYNLKPKYSQISAARMNMIYSYFGVDYRGRGIDCPLFDKSGIYIPKKLAEALN